MRASFAAFLSLTLVCTPVVQAQNAVPAPSGALRAPLQIVPAPMQAAIEQAVLEQAVRGGTTGDGRSKLAPRVAARQMKRAVRAVAATPGADSDVVQIGQLGALEDAPVGLEEGFGNALWTGARLAFVADQMARLPTDLAMSALYELERRLHRGATAAPIGTADRTSWFAARLMRLLSLGDTQSVLALEAETGAARNDGYVARVLALAHLGRGDRAAACAVPRPARGTTGRRDTLEFFMHMLVFCQLLDGAFEKAGLTLELNAKTLGDDTLFRDMAYFMSAQVPLTFGTKEEAEAAKKAGTQAPIILPDELTPMQIALLQLAGQALPQGLMNLPNYFMQAVATDFAQDPLVQLSAAHMAVRFGASPELFSQAAQLADLSSVSGALPAAAPESDAVFLAQALRIIDAADRQAQPRLVAYYLRQARLRDLWHDMIAILDDRLATLMVPQAVPPMAPDTALAGTASEPDVSGPDIIEPPQGAENLPAPLQEADRLILLLAHWQAGHRAQADNLINLTPLGPDMQLLARWQGFETPVPVAFADGAVTDPARAGADVAILDPDTLPAIGDAAVINDETLAAMSSTEFEMAPALPDLALDLQPDWSVFEARLENVSAAEALFVRRQLALYHALGVRLSDRLMSDLVLPEDNPAAQRLARLADNKWIGDLILAQIAHLADKPTDSYDALDTHLLVGNLRRAGLQDAAQAMAADMMLSHLAGLAVRAPQTLFGDAPAYASYPFEQARDGQ